MAVAVDRVSEGAADAAVFEPSAVAVGGVGSGGGLQGGLGAAGAALARIRVAAGTEADAVA